MNYSGIITDDIANGTGIRTSLFVSGCRNNCPGCFNKEEQDFNYGKPFTEDTIKYILDSIDDEYHDGISILGGDPLEPENAEEVYKLIKAFRERYDHNKSIWLYTGYTFEKLERYRDIRKNLIYECDVLVDGPFIESSKDITLKFKGSSNQRIINMVATKADKYHTPAVIG